MDFRDLNLASDHPLKRKLMLTLVTPKGTPLDGVANLTFDPSLKRKLMLTCVMRKLMLTWVDPAVLSPLPCVHHYGLAISTDPRWTVGEGLCCGVP